MKAMNAEGSLQVSELDKTVRFTLPAVPVQSLTSPTGFKFQLPYDSADIDHIYRHVRIRKLDVEFGSSSQPSTAKGEIMVELQTDTVLEDRDLDGKPLTFVCAEPGEYLCNYNLSDPEKNLIKDKASNRIQYTPFTKWTVRLADSFSVNKGIQFPSATAQVTLKFQLDAIVKADSGVFCYKKSLPPRLFIST